MSEFLFLTKNWTTLAVADWFASCEAWGISALDRTSRSGVGFVRKGATESRLSGGGQPEIKSLLASQIDLWHIVIDWEVSLPSVAVEKRPPKAEGR